MSGPSVLDAAIATYVAMRRQRQRTRRRFLLALVASGALLLVSLGLTFVLDGWSFGLLCVGTAGLGASLGFGVGLLVMERAYERH